ncbi:hypothetical protein BpHYR1_031468 [Brachionus plicatilis]|uniref:Uncharacterized protein n=1 Tax=Brachionus plicatilis TaxID=10195 RepID=A0A3M7RM76_BRAPC|nr:hypothetical protein BpHYR1_031468 [Brachionus plicatilis]
MDSFFTQNADQPKYLNFVGKNSKIAKTKHRCHHHPMHLDKHWNPIFLHTTNLIFSQTKSWINN